MRTTEDLDQLVPPPWTVRRRVAVAAAIGVLVVVLGAAWWTGAAVPRLSGETSGGDWRQGSVVDGYVTDLDVTLRFEIENHGRFTTIVTGWGPPEVRGVEWNPNSDQFPLELTPGEGAEVQMSARVDDCTDIDLAGPDALVVRARTLLPVSLPTSIGLHGVNQTPPWLEGRGRTGSSGDASWIYDALAWPCDPEAQ